MHYNSQQIYNILSNFTLLLSNYILLNTYIHAQILTKRHKAARLRTIKIKIYFTFLHKVLLRYTFNINHQYTAFIHTIVNMMLVCLLILFFSQIIKAENCSCERSITGTICYNCIPTKISLTTILTSDLILDFATQSDIIAAKEEIWPYLKTIKSKTQHFTCIDGKCM